MLHCSARETDWKYLHNPIFRVLYPVISRNDHPPPLQIRAFTSDSYQALKKRERKKIGRRERNSTEQRSSVWEGDVGASPLAVPMQEVTRMDSRPHNVVPSTHSGGSGTELLVVQDGGGTGKDDEHQHRLDSPGAGTAPTSLVNDPSDGEIQHLAAPSSLVIPLHVCCSDSNVPTSAEQELETGYSAVHNPHPTSRENDDPITIGGDNDTFDQQLYSRTQNDTGLAAESPSYPTTADNSAQGRSSPFKQLTECCGTGHPRPLSFELNSAPAAAPATGLEWPPGTLTADGAHDEALPNDTDPTDGVAGTFGSLIHRSTSQQRGNNCISMCQSTWTSGQDEQLLHLRDTAQLNWKKVVSYFPEVSLDAIRRRYKHLDGLRLVSQTAPKVPRPQVQTPKATTNLISSTPQKAAKNLRAPLRTKVSKRPVNALSTHQSTSHHRRETKKAKSAKYVASVAVAAHEDACPRTSRCGRAIRHPFRHRPSDGYV